MSVTESFKSPRLLLFNLLSLVFIVGCGPSTPNSDLVRFAERAHIYENVEIRDVQAIILRDPNAYIQLVSSGHNEFVALGSRIFLENHISLVPTLILVYVEHGTRPTYLRSAYSLCKGLESKKSDQNESWVTGQISQSLNKHLEYCVRNPILLNEDFMALAHLVVDFGSKALFDEFNFFDDRFFDLPIEEQTKLIKKIKARDNHLIESSTDKIRANIEDKMKEMVSYRSNL